MSTPKRPKRPRDPIQLAHEVFQEAIGEKPKAFDPATAVPEQPEPQAEPERVKDPAAVSLGRRGGRKGGLMRAAALTPEERKESARKAAAARWAKRKPE